jgi:peptide/nickel transport system substrate-binding protein
MYPIGTGPFIFDSYVPGETVTLIRNDEYWGGKWTLEKLVFRFIPDDNARTLGLLSGELDVVKGLGEKEWIEMVEKGGYIVYFFGPTVVPTLSFQMTNEYLANKKVRLAIVHAINREDIAEVQGPSTEPVYGALHSSWKYATDDVKKYDYDPELAKKYLAEAGYPDGFKIEVYSSERAGYLKQYTVIQEQLRKIGINMVVNVVDHTTYWSNNFDDLNPMCITGYIQFPTAGVWLRAFGHSNSIVGKPTASFNFSHYGELGGSIDALLNSAAGQPEEMQRLLLEVAQKQVMLDLPFFNYIGSQGTGGRNPYVDLGYSGELSSRGGFWMRLTKDTAILKH